MKWTKKKSGKTVSKRVFGSALLFLLSGLLSLSLSSPASALDSSVSSDGQSRYFVNSPYHRWLNTCISPHNSSGILSTSTQTLEVFDGSCGNTISTYAGGFWEIGLVLELPFAQNNYPNVTLYGDYLNDANRVVGIDIVATYDGASTRHVVYKITGYSTYVGTLNPKLTVDILSGNGEYVKLRVIYAGRYKVGYDSITDELNSISSYLSSIESDTDTIRDIVGQSNNKLEAIRQGMQNTYNQLQDIKSYLNDNQNTLDDIKDNQDAQATQDAQDRQDAQDAVDGSETSAEASGQAVDNATSNVTGSMASIVGAIINAPTTDCLISITAGEKGVLQMRNLNLCSAPTEVLSLIHTISSIVITLAVLWCAYSLFSAVMGIFEAIQGGRLA